MSNLPIPDFSAPSEKHIDRFPSFVNQKAKGSKVVVHCKAGRGRTGTMLAVYLVSKGVAGKVAIQRVRNLRPGSVETQVQEQAVLDHASAQNREKG